MLSLTSHSIVVNHFPSRPLSNHPSNHPTIYLSIHPSICSSIDQMAGVRKRVKDLESSHLESQTSGGTRLFVNLWDASQVHRGWTSAARRPSLEGRMWHLGATLISIMPAQTLIRWFEVIMRSEVSAMEVKIDSEWDGNSSVPVGQRAEGFLIWFCWEGKEGNSEQ